MRLEDVNPGRFYAEPEALTKLKAVGDYLKSEDIPFLISLIPRSVVPDKNYDKSIDQTDDPFIIAFNDTLAYLKENCGAYLGIHGYTHQYGGSASGLGYEFHNTESPIANPPDDPVEATQDSAAFMASYAYSRMYKGYTTFQKSGLSLCWGYEAPHYAASNVQRQILEACFGCFFEPGPGNYYKRTVTTLDEDHPFYQGVIYVPAPLGYVHGENPQGSVDWIIGEMQQYTDDELAAFFYHPYLEFRFITIQDDGRVVYSGDSYLKQLIRAFKEEERTFIPPSGVTDFVPASRATGLFPGSENIVIANRGESTNATQFFNWQPDTGTWHYIDLDLINFPNRTKAAADSQTLYALDNWAVGSNYRPFVGDFNGDGYQDVAVWNPLNGEWTVALGNGQDLKPDASPWISGWGIGDAFLPLIGDYNGDGKDDILLYNPQNGSFKVALSNGTRFVPSLGQGNYNWLSNWAAGSYWQAVAGDFNGDGKTDIAVLSRNSGSVQVALSNGSVLVPAIGPGNFLWAENWAPGANWKLMAGDFNGDGKTDLISVDCVNGLWKVALSTGVSFEPSKNVFGPWGAGSDMQPFVVNPVRGGKSSIIARHPDLRGGTFDGAISILGDAGFFSGSAGSNS